jgi:diketogulonate reductase-like aldo/keto reductase
MDRRRFLKKSAAGALGAGAGAMTGWGKAGQEAKAMKGRDRRSVFITTKLQVEKDTSKEGFLKRARKCLEDLEMDYIDCLMMHMPEKVATLKTEGFHAAMPAACARPPVPIMSRSRAC